MSTVGNKPKDVVNISTVGDLTVTGNTILGDAGGDTVTINAGTATIPNGLSMLGGALHVPGGGGVASNEAFGVNALQSNTTGVSNTASGVSALLSNTTGSYNTASGQNALRSNTTGVSNTASGMSALSSNTTGYNNTASGVSALNSNTTFANISGFGYNSAVTGSDQVQLGDAATTTYVYGTVANRSDLRDKADITDTALGLTFINALRPVDYRWDMRED